MKKNLLIVSLISSLAFSSLSAASAGIDSKYLQMAKEEINLFKKKLPVKNGPGIQISKVSISDTGLIKYSIDIDSRKIERDTNAKPTADLAKKIKPFVLASFRGPQVKNMCSNKQSLDTILNGLSYEYAYYFDNGIYVGSNYVNKKVCNNFLKRGKKR